MKSHKMHRWPTLVTLQFLTLFVIHLFSISLSAQTTTSNIEGTITDANGAVVSGAQVKVVSTTLGTDRTVVTNKDGTYRIVSLPAGTYTITVTQTGFAPNVSNVELTLNRVAKFDVQLQVGNIGGEVVVNDVLPLLEPNASSTGSTITPKQIQDLPVNGRDYLDLMALVPGVAINRQATDGDNANPVLGERSGNNNFLIDGHSNKDTVNGGPAAQFNQESISEFQVMTTGYKAEFGQASGATVNVITRSGGNKFHGVGSFFHRNDVFDSSNSLDPAVTDAPELKRYDYSFAIGGPIWKDKVFFFGSAERITEDREIDFKYPEVPQVLLNLLHAQEDPINDLQNSREPRYFLKVNEQFGIHQLSQEFNYTKENVTGTGVGLPSTRSNTNGSHFLLAFGDTMLLGDQGNPWITTLRASFRDEPSDISAAHPEFLGLTAYSGFTSVINWPRPLSQGVPFFGDLATVAFGYPNTPSNLDQNYMSFSASTNRRFGDHDLKFGWQYLKTKADGLDSHLLQNQLFATVSDFTTLGPINSGVFLIGEVGGITPAGDEIHLSNNYNSLFVQDDWKVGKSVTLNLGLRWEKDSEFTSNNNYSPRLGIAWAAGPKTIIRAHFGKFFDQFRLGLVRNIPAFGGSDRRLVQSLFFPRGFYGSPSAVSSLAILSGLPGPCISNNQTDAQIASTGTTCIGGPVVGIDRLNRVVLAGHAFIPANTAINISNVLSLTGLTPDQYAAQAAAAINQPNGYFVWGRYGVLNNPIIPPQPQAVSVDSTFKTPHTLSYSFGVQQEITSDMVLEVDYFHRNMRNLLGLRQSNLGFRSRVAGIGRSFDPPNPTGEINTYGPFYEGKYDAMVVNFNKRLSNHYMFGANYTFAKATDNSRGIFSLPSDSFVGTVPTVVEPCAAGNPGCVQQTNANGPFTSRNGKFVAQSGTFLNGPDLDKGPSDLALNHIFQVFGLVDLPWQFQISGNFRVQSGFHYSRNDPLADADGNSNFTGIDVIAGRNAFTAPAFINTDVRFSKRFSLSESVKLQVLFEFFNLLNRQNPAAIQVREGVLNSPFGSTLQVLPGREGQIGFRIEF